MFRRIRGGLLLTGRSIFFCRRRCWGVGGLNGEWDLGHGVAAMEGERIFGEVVAALMRGEAIGAGGGEARGAGGGEARGAGGGEARGEAIGEAIGAGRAEAARGEGTQGARLLTRLRAHLLAPLAWRAGVAGLRKDYIAAAMHAERREALLVEALEVLRGQEVMLLKGMAYVGSIYADAAERPMTDIDLLVREARFEDAAAALRRAGYWHDGKRNQHSAANHAVTFRRHESAIDLHRGMVQRGRMGVDLGAVWRDAITARHGALRPSPSHEYLMHVAHMARHELTVPLIAFVDAARLRPLAGDVGGLAARWRLRRAVVLVEERVEALREPRRPLPTSLFPDRRELYEGGLPARWLQVVRKLAIHDGARDYVTFAAASIRTRLGV